MTQTDPRSIFPGFYTNPVIRALGTACRWTISGQLGDISDDDTDSKRKAPIDVRHLIAGCNPGCRHTGPLRGAFALDATCLMTLDELTDVLPNAANTAYYLQAQTDGLIVIDIEPECPPEIAAGLLQLPGIHYSELSMSGRGFHLLTSLPDNLHDFPQAVGKRVLRHVNGWYEILFDHWVTFTRSPVPEALTRQSRATTLPQFATVDDLYADLAATAKASHSASSIAISTEGDISAIPFAASIVDSTLTMAKERLRSPDQFANDTSRWEFSVLATLYNCMQQYVNTYSSLTDHIYTASDRAWLLYDAVRQTVPFRQKHTQTRNGRPFLLDRAAALIAEREAANTAQT